MKMQKRNLPYRKSIRLKGWDYRSPALYFITVCTQGREHHFGEIRCKMMGLSVPGCVAWHFWRQIPNHQSNVVLDEFVVMPNHIHGIVGILPVGALHVASAQGQATSSSKSQTMSDISPKSGSLSAIIRSYKSAVTKWCNRNNHDYFAWQPRFYDHIIRNDKSLDRIREYIYNNPFDWDDDQENPNRVHERAVEYMMDR